MKDMRRDGSVLIVVLWVIALLSILVAGLGSRGVFALEMTARMEQQLQLSYLATAGVQHALNILARDPSEAYDGLNEEWVNNEMVFAKQSLGGGWFTLSYMASDRPGTPLYGFTDEERKVNLNTAPEEVLQYLVAQTGLLRDHEITTVVEAIQDWRDQDKEQRPSGAEDFYYLGLSEAYECKDGPFEDLEELRLVRGVTPELAERLAPYVTVYGSGNVNVNTAEVTVLRALGLSETGVYGLISYRAGEDAQERTPDDRVVTAPSAVGSELSSYLPAEDVNRLTQLVQADFLTVASEDFHLSITAQTEETPPLELQCVVNRWSGQVKVLMER